MQSSALLTKETVGCFFKDIIVKSQDDKHPLRDGLRKAQDTFFTHVRQLQEGATPAPQRKLASQIAAAIKASVFTDLVVAATIQQDLEEAKSVKLAALIKEAEDSLLNSLQDIREQTRVQTQVPDKIQTGFTSHTEKKEELSNRVWNIEELCEDLFEEGKKHFANQQWDEAIACLLSAIEKQNESPLKDTADAKEFILDCHLQIIKVYKRQCNLHARKKEYLEAAGKTWLVLTQFTLIDQQFTAGEISLHGVKLKKLQQDRVEFEFSLGSLLIRHALAFKETNQLSSDAQNWLHWRNTRTLLIRRFKEDEKFSININKLRSREKELAKVFFSQGEKFYKEKNYQAALFCFKHANLSGSCLQNEEEIVDDIDKCKRYIATCCYQLQLVNAKEKTTLLQTAVTTVSSITKKNSDDRENQLLYQERLDSALNKNNAAADTPISTPRKLKHGFFDRETPAAPKKLKFERNNTPQGPR